MSGDKKRDYKVGYRKPPKDKQFKPGQSGNCRGRPKGSKSFSTALEAELQSFIPITENGKRRMISKMRAIAKQIITKAAAGDMKAIGLYLKEIRRYDELMAQSRVSQSAISPTMPATLEEAEKAYWEAIKNAKISE